MDRTSQENEAINSFFRGLKCFEDIEMSNSDFNKIVNSMKTSYLRRGDILFEIGDVSDSFFIILYGQCELYLPNPEIGVIKNRRKAVEGELEKITRSITILQQ